MITYRQVKLADTQSTIESFLQCQWPHTGDNHLACKPNWPVYYALEKNDSLILLLAYDGDEPIGYLAAFVHPHLNSVDNFVASIPTYYVVERPARSLVLRRLFERTITLLKERKVVLIMADTVWTNSAGRLLSGMGFHEAKIGYKLLL